jgi:hypothetical protein
VDDLGLSGFKIFGFGVRGVMVVKLGGAVFVEDQAVIIGADGLCSSIICDGAVAGSEWILYLWK